MLKVPMMGIVKRRLASDPRKLSRVRPASGAFNAVTETGKTTSIHDGSRSARWVDETSGRISRRRLKASMVLHKYCIFVVEVVSERRCGSNVKAVRWWKYKFSGVMDNDFQFNAHLNARVDPL
jgi:hypothetical protein